MYDDLLFELMYVRKLHILSTKFICWTFQMGETIDEWTLHGVHVICLVLQFIASVPKLFLTLSSLLVSLLIQDESSLHLSYYFESCNFENFQKKC